MLTSLFKKLKNKVNPPINMSSFDDNEIIKYKSQAWNSSFAAEKYVQDVEYAYFEYITADYFLRHIHSTDTVLDVGAGTGRLSYLVADLGCAVTSVDISGYMLDILERGVGGRNITTKVSGAEKLPFPDETFNVVVQADFLAHFPNWKNILQEERRVCKEDGLIIFNFFNGDNLEKYHGTRKEAVEYLTNDDFIANCTREELEIFCNSNGLEIIKIYPFNYFNINIFYSEVLTKEENVMLMNLMNKLNKSEKILHIMKRIQDEIIAHIEPEYCTRMIVVLKKLNNRIS